MGRTVHGLRECCSRVTPSGRREVGPTELVPVVRAARVEADGSTCELDRRLSLIQIRRFASSPGITIGLQGAKTNRSSRDADESDANDKRGGKAPPSGKNGVGAEGRRGSESNPWDPINPNRADRNESMRPVACHTG